MLSRAGSSLGCKTCIESSGFLLMAMPGTALAAPTGFPSRLLQVLFRRRCAHSGEQAVKREQRPLVLDAGTHLGDRRFQIGDEAPAIDDPLLYQEPASKHVTGQEAGDRRRQRLRIDILVHGFLVRNGRQPRQVAASRSTAAPWAPALPGLQAARALRGMAGWTAGASPRNNGGTVGGPRWIGWCTISTASSTARRFRANTAPSTAPCATPATCCAANARFATSRVRNESGWRLPRSMRGARQTRPRSARKTTHDGCPGLGVG